MKKIYYFFAFMVGIVALMVLDQVWFQLIPAEYFIKVLVTIGIISGAILGIILLRAEWVEDKRLKDDNYLD